MLTAQALIGRVLGGQYRIDTLLGQGGFGAVFRAWDLQLDRTVAVKVIVHAAAGALAARFRREAQMQARFRHPAIVRLLHFGEDDGLCFMVQEFVDGRTLRAVVDHDGPLDAARAARFFGTVLEALDEAHAEGVVHRDLKPENIMVVTGRFGEEPRLLDFGIAKIIEESEALSNLTASGALIGTPAYLSPEQAYRQPVTPASDLYSLGCVMHYALTGRKPFIGTTVQVIMDHAQRPPPPLPDHLPPALTSTVRRAMAKQPIDRYGSALAMKAALDGHGAPITDPPPPPPRTPDSATALDATPLDISDLGVPPPPTPRRRPGRQWLTLVALVALVAVASGFAAWWLGGTPVHDGARETAPDTARIAIGSPPAPSTRRAVSPILDADAAPEPSPDAAPDPPPDAAPDTPPDATPAAPTVAAARAPRRRPARPRRVAAQPPPEATVRGSAPEDTAVEQARRIQRDRERLDRALTRALADCVCDNETEALVDRLDREHGINRRAEFTRTCKIPGLPTSCIGR